MIPQKRPIILIIIIIAAIYAGFIIWNESFYLDPAPFLSPIAHNSALPISPFLKGTGKEKDYPFLIRNDWRGEGDFGARRNGNRTHQGIDILAPVGTPVRAAKGGIAFANENKKGLGKYVEIKHRKGLVTIYSHLYKISIKSFQKVRQGQVIGEVGKTGNARYNGIQPHLHFEVRERGVAVDPKRYLSR